MATQEGPPLESWLDSQTLLYARDVARVHALRRMYERLVPVPLDLTKAAIPRPIVRDATLLFTDVRDFTGFAQRLDRDPDRLLAILNEHFEVVVRAVLRCGGTVEKFLGDGLFATFGAWDEEPAAASRALAAAIGVIGANEALNRRRGAEWGFRLAVGAAITTGRVVLGQVGPAERCEVGVLGDPVNVAARLVGQAHGGEVLIGPATYRAVSDQVSADLLGDQVVRGRVGRIDVYRLNLTARRSNLQNTPSPRPGEGGVGGKFSSPRVRRSHAMSKR